MQTAKQKNQQPINSLDFQSLAGEKSHNSTRITDLYSNHLFVLNAMTLSFLLPPQRCLQILWCPQKEQCASVCIPDSYTNLIRGPWQAWTAWAAWAEWAEWAVWAWDFSALCPPSLSSIDKFSLILPAKLARAGLSTPQSCNKFRFECTPAAVVGQCPSWR